MKTALSDFIKVGLETASTDFKNVDFNRILLNTVF